MKDKYKKGYKGSMYQLKLDSNYAQYKLFININFLKRG